jgi:hypothetical protein
MFLQQALYYFRMALFPYGAKIPTSAAPPSPSTKIMRKSVAVLAALAAAVFHLRRGKEFNGGDKAVPGPQPGFVCHWRI